MRWLVLLLNLAVASCSGPSADAGPVSGSYSGGGRDRLCIAGIAGKGAARRAGVIAYGAGDANCSAAGVLVKDGGGFALVPLGEGACRIGLSANGDTASVTNMPAACKYVCGPGAGLAGKVFRRDAVVKPVTDFGGDPLC